MQRLKHVYLLGITTNKKEHVLSSLFYLIYRSDDATAFQEVCVSDSSCLISQSRGLWHDKSSLTNMKSVFLAENFLTWRGRSKEFKGLINPADKQTFYYFILFFQGQTQTSLSSVFRLGCQLQSNALVLLPAGFATASCVTAKPAGRWTADEGNSSRRRAPHCAKVQRLHAPLIIARCDSALSLCYHGEGKVAGRGHVINIQLFDSSLWRDSSRLYWSLLPSWASGEVYKLTIFWSFFCKVLSQFTLRRM